MIALKRVYRTNNQVTGEKSATYQFLDWEDGRQELWVSWPDMEPQLIATGVAEREVELTLSLSLYGGSRNAHPVVSGIDCMGNPRWATQYYDEDIIEI